MYLERKINKLINNKFYLKRGSNPGTFIRPGHGTLTVEPHATCELCKMCKYSQHNNCKNHRPLQLLRLVKESNFQNSNKLKVLSAQILKLSNPKILPFLRTKKSIHNCEQRQVEKDKKCCDWDQTIRLNQIFVRFMSLL